VKLLHLHAENYRSFQEIDFDFPSGACAIIGPNGAGKSTLLGAVDLALFCAKGELPPYLSEDAVGDLMVELTFEHGGETYRVRRGYSANGRGKATCDFEKLGPDWHAEPGPNGEPVQVQSYPDWEPLTAETIDATNEKICATIGLTRETFRASAYLAQGDGSFADPSWQPRQRKQLLFSALGLDQTWTPLKDKASADKRECEVQRQVLSGRIGTLEETVAGKEEAKQRAEQAAFAARAAQTRLEEATAAVETARTKVSDAERVESEQSAARARLQAAEGDWQRIEADQDTAEKASAGLAEIEPRIAALEPVAAGKAGAELLIAQAEEDRVALDSTLRGCEERVRVRDDRVRKIEQRAAEIEGLKAKAVAAENAAGRVGSGEIQTCQTCGQPIADEAAEKVRHGYLDEALAAREKAEALISENASDQALVNDAVTIDAELATARDGAAKITDRITRARETLHKAQEAEIELVRLNAQADNFRASVAKVEGDEWIGLVSAAELALKEAQVVAASLPAAVDIGLLRRDAESKSNVLAAARSAAREADAEKIRAEEALARIAEAEGQLAETASEREALDAEHDLLCQLERAYGRDGIPALIVENSVGEIEEEADRIVAMLQTESISCRGVQLRTQREKKDGDLKDTLDIIVLTDTGARPYETFSGGEQARVNVALRIALLRFIRRMGGGCDALLIDELGFLDDAGMERFVDLLGELRAEFSLIALVSHIPAIRDAIDSAIEIRKDGSRSEVAA